MGLDYKKKYLKYKNKYLEAKKIYGGGTPAAGDTPDDSNTNAALEKEIRLLKADIDTLNRMDVGSKIKSLMNKCSNCTTQQEVDNLQSELKQFKLKMGLDTQSVDLHSDDTKRKAQIEEMELPDAEKALEFLRKKIVEKDADPGRDEGRRQEMGQALGIETIGNKLIAVKKLIEEFYIILNNLSTGPAEEDSAPEAPAPAVENAPVEQPEGVGVPESPAAKDAPVEQSEGDAVPESPASEDAPADESEEVVAPEAPAAKDAPVEQSEEVPEEPAKAGPEPKPAPKPPLQTRNETRAARAARAARLQQNQAQAMLEHVRRNSPSRRRGA